LKATNPNLNVYLQNPSWSGSSLPGKDFLDWLSNGPGQELLDIAVLRKPLQNPGLVKATFLFAADVTPKIRCQSSKAIRWTYLLGMTCVRYADYLTLSKRSGLPYCLNFRSLENS
jgi:hypothetical protein